MRNSLRQYSLFDKCLINLDQMLKTLLPERQLVGTNPSPAKDCPDVNFTPKEQRYIAGLMRINHTGEVCAQALYQGQALTARSAAIKVKFEQAAKEEGDHLAWCAQRLTELNSRPSFFKSAMVYGIVGHGRNGRFNQRSGEFRVFSRNRAPSRATLDGTFAEIADYRSEEP